MAEAGAGERLGGAQIVVVEDEAAVAREAARRIVAALAEALAQRGVAHIALTGGSSAVSLYRELRGRPFIQYRRFVFL